MRNVVICRIMFSARASSIEDVCADCLVIPIQEYHKLLSMMPVSRRMSMKWQVNADSVIVTASGSHVTHWVAHLIVYTDGDGPSIMRMCEFDVVNGATVENWEDTTSRLEAKLRPLSH
jgi:hypothetical protein